MKARLAVAVQNEGMAGGDVLGRWQFPNNHFLARLYCSGEEILVEKVGEMG
jgi:hypothetical protein